MTIRLPRFLVFVVPILILIGQILCEIFVPVKLKPAFNSESGPLETMEALILGIALFFSVKAFLASDTVWLRLWTAFAAVSCFYVLGEEISWGQQFLHWSTPEYWAQFNDQDETNLHNTSDWLDQKPRLILEIGVLIGGLIIPLLQKFKPQKLPQKFAAIYGDWQLLPTALIAFLVKMSGLTTKMTGIKVFWRESEVEEIYLYYFVLLYLLFLLRRMQAGSGQ